MAQAVESPDLHQLFSIRSMTGDVLQNNKGYLMGLAPALTFIGLSHHSAQEIQTFSMAAYINDLKVELIAGSVAALFWGEMQHVKAHGKRQKFLSLDKARNDAKENFPGAWALLENVKPSDENEERQLTEGIKNEIGKVMAGPKGVDPKLISKMAEQTIGLYHAKKTIEEGVDSSGGLRMWLEVAKEALQAGSLVFSVASVVDLFLSIGLPMSANASVSFSLTDSESFANLTRWTSLIPLAFLALGEVRKSRFEDAEYLAGGIEHQAHERAQKNGGQHG